MTATHQHAAYPAREDGRIGPSALSAPAGIRLAVALGLAAVLWLAVAWALGWLA